MAKYRTEKPSKSPPPPPPRRSFPSAHGLTTNRTGDVIVTTKSMKVGGGRRRMNLIGQQFLAMRGNVIR